MKRGVFLAFAACLAAAPAAGGEEAVLTGSVRGEPRAQGGAASAGAYSGRVPQVFDYARLRDVVVYAVPADSSPPTDAAGAGEAVTVEGNRHGLRIAPAFLAVSSGTEVAFINRTREPVTLYAGGGSAAAFGIALAPLEERRTRLQTAGLYRLFCLEDENARGRLFVAGPYLSLVDSEGRYRLVLPGGRYRVTAWHERLPAQTREMKLEDGGTHELSFTLAVQGLPEVP